MHKDRLVHILQNVRRIPRDAVLLVLVAFVFVVAYVFGSDTGNPSVVIEMTAQGFSTSTVTIHQGDTVLFRNSDSVPHWPASDKHPTHNEYPGSDWRKCGTLSEVFILDSCKPVQPEGSYVFTFRKSGNWHLHDHLFPRVTTTIVVQDTEHYVESPRHIARVAIANSIEFLGRSVDGVLNFFLVQYSKSTHTVPPDPLYGSFSGEDMVTATDYTRANVPAIVKSDLEVMRMISKLGLPKTAELVATEPTYVYDSGSCHTAMHVVGRMAFDLSGFKAFEQCSTACFSGCYHGALERIGSSADAAHLLMQEKEYCYARDTVFNQVQCFHGMGHAFMLYARYDIFSALKACGGLGADMARDACYGGLFMENYIGDPALVGAENPTQFSESDLHYPCTVLTGDSVVQDWCYRAQPNHFLAVFNGDERKAAQECLKAPTFTARASCIRRLGQLAGVDVPNPSKATEDFCTSLPSEYLKECIVGGYRLATVLPGPDPEGKPVSFCRGLMSVAAKEICYTEYAKGLTEMFLEKEVRDHVCSLFEPPYNERCLVVQ